MTAPAPEITAISKQGPENQHPETSEPAHISADKFRRTEIKQRKPNKPASHQTDQNIAKPAS